MSLMRSSYRKTVASALGVYSLSLSLAALFAKKPEKQTTERGSI